MMLGAAARSKYVTSTSIDTVYSYYSYSSCLADLIETGTSRSRVARE